MSLAFDDPVPTRSSKDANTTAIFQVESEGMKKLLKKLAPDRFEDIIAVLAALPSRARWFRDGGRLHPAQEGPAEDRLFPPRPETACLSPTYGVIVYQEQVMQISQIIGGYTLGGADMLRRAMGKKKPEEWPSTARPSPPAPEAATIRRWPSSCST